jgi:hypothetical protein
MTNVIVLKLCCTCRKDKPLNNFTKDKRRKDGLYPRCKECNSVYYKKNILHERQRRKEYRIKVKSDPIKYQIHRVSHSIGVKKYNKFNKIKLKAVSSVNYAVKCGKLERPNKCSECFLECKPEAHHDSYDFDNWLKVRWLCRQCHAAHHRKYKSENMQILFAEKANQQTTSKQPENTNEQQQQPSSDITATTDSGQS